MGSIGTRSSLIKDLIFRGASDVLNALIGLAIIALVARQLDTGAYGIYTQVVTTVSLFVPLLLLRLNTACVRFFPTIINDKADLRRHFTTVVLTVFAVSLMAVILFVMAAKWSAQLIFGQAAPLRLMLLLCLYLLLRSMVTLFIDYFRAMNRSTLASGYNSLRFLLVLLCLIYAVLSNSGVHGILSAHVVAELLILVVSGYHLYRDKVLGFIAQWQPRDIKPYLAYSLPLLPYSMFLTVNQFADRYFITHLVGLEATGVYSFSYTLIMSAFLLNASISYVIYPHLCRLWEDGNMDAVRDQIETGQRLFIAIAIPIAFGFFAIYAAVVSAMVGPEFVISMVAVISIVVGQIMLGLCSIFGFIIDLSKRTTFFVKVLFATATLNLILNTLLVPSYGIAGAAVATAITYAAQLLLMWFATREIAPFKVRVDFRFIGQCAVLAAVMLACLQLLQPLNGIGDIFLAVGLGALIYLAGALAMFRQHIKEARALFVK